MKFLKEIWKKILLSLLLLLITSITMGVIEPAFFTLWALIYNKPLNEAWFLGHFSWVCIGFGILAASPLLALLGDGIIDKDREGILVYGTLTPSGLLLWAVVEDFFAHLRFGSLPFNDWTHWGWHPFIRLWENFWLPNWYLIALTLFILSILIIYLIDHHWRDTGEH